MGMRPVTIKVPGPFPYRKPPHLLQRGGRSSVRGEGLSLESGSSIESCAVRSSEDENLVELAVNRLDHYPPNSKRIGVKWNSVWFYQVAKTSTIPISGPLEVMLNNVRCSRGIKLSISLVLFGDAVSIATHVNAKGFRGVESSLLLFGLFEINPVKRPRGMLLLLSWVSLRRLWSSYIKARRPETWRYLDPVGGSKR
ncbi:hypothetical protein VNO77_08183 [Canavalia gladiata]|uniref:Uncharacterized protein n=1 Tax=Canavalia gladiata TaxID=3824 RepID=A0AAN9MDV6_CANGL